MEIILIEDEVFRVTNNDYNAIRSKQDELNSLPFDANYNKQMVMEDFIDEMKPRLKMIGQVMYDFKG